MGVPLFDLATGLAKGGAQLVADVRRPFSDGVPLFDLAAGLAKGGAQLVADVRRPFSDQEFQEAQRRATLDRQQTQGLLDDYFKRIADNRRTEQRLTQEAEDRAPGQARALADVVNNTADREANRKILLEGAQTGNVKGLVNTVGGVTQKVEGNRSNLKINEDRARTENEIQFSGAKTSDEIRRLGAQFQGLQGLIGSNNDAAYRSQAAMFGGDPNNSTIDRVLAAQRDERQGITDLVRYGIDLSKPKGVARFVNDLMPVAQLGALILGATRA